MSEYACEEVRWKLNVLEGVRVEECVRAFVSLRGRARARVCVCVRGHDHTEALALCFILKDNVSWQRHGRHDPNGGGETSGASERGCMRACEGKSHNPSHICRCAKEHNQPEEQGTNLSNVTMSCCSAVSEAYWINSSIRSFMAHRRESRG